MNEPSVKVTTNEARAGSTPHIVRYVLGISLTLAVVAIAILAFARSF